MPKVISTRMDRICGVACFALLLSTMVFPCLAFADPAMDCKGTIQAWIISGYYKSGDCHCSPDGKPVCPAVTSGHSSGGSSGSHSVQNAVKSQVLQGVVDGIVNGMFPAPRQNKTQLVVEGWSEKDEELREQAEENFTNQLQIEKKQVNDSKAKLLPSLKGLE